MWRWLGFGLLGGLALAACGDDEGSTTPVGPGAPPGAEGGGGSGEGGASATGTPLARSGTRLRRRDRVVGDTRQFQNWYDSSLEADCRFRPVSDDTWRCVPNPGLIRRFLDAACTQPVVLRGACSEARFGVLDPSDGCSPREFEVFRAGAPVATPGAVYSAQEDGSCTALSASAVEGFDFFEVSPVAPDELVTVVPAVEDRGAELGARVFETEGGAAGIIGLVDLARNATSCSVRNFTETEPPICLPDAAPIVGGGVFGDDACSGVEVGINGACVGPEPPPLMLMVTSNGCDGTTTSLRAPGAEATTVFSGGPGSCAPFPLDGRGAYAVGAEVEPGAVRTLTPQLRGADVQVLGALDDRGALVAELTNNVFDAEGNRCFTLEAEGGFRCLPESTIIYAPSIFADAACQEIIVPTELDGCAGPPAVYALDPPPPDDVCGISRVEELHAPEASFDGAEIYSRVNDVCTAGPRGDTTFVRLGAPLALTSFPLVQTNVIE